jgi:hypothetical protein
VGAVLRLFCVESLRALARNKLRSGLAAMAITIGIAAVVCVMAIGQAGSRRAEEQLANLGENFVCIEAGSRAPSGVRTGARGARRRAGLLRAGGALLRLLSGAGSVAPRPHRSPAPRVKMRRNHRSPVRITDSPHMYGC